MSLILNKDNLQTREHEQHRYCGKAGKAGQCCLGGTIGHGEYLGFFFYFKTRHIYLRNLQLQEAVPISTGAS